MRLKKRVQDFLFHFFLSVYGFCWREFKFLWKKWMWQINYILNIIHCEDLKMTSLTDMSIKH